MKRSLYVVLAVILIFTGVFTGVSIWQHNRSMSAFAADGYILAGEAETGVVSCDYFSAGTRYARNYEDQVKFVSSMGQKKSVERESFIHYSDGSISAFSAGSLLNLDEVQAGSVTAYFLGEKMVLTSGADGYTIDNNGTELEFRNFLWMVDDLKFLVGGQNMVLSLPSGTSQDLSGYLEVDYIDETIVQICNEEQIWQTVPAGASITLDNGVVIAAGLGVPESVIALTVVALGTSLPELVTAITSLVKGHGALSLGNVIGANLFNLVLVNGVSVALAPFGLPAGSTIAGHNASLVLDLPVAFVVMVLLVAPPLCKGRLYRWQGVALLAIYAAYCAVQFSL